MSAKIYCEDCRFCVVIETGKKFARCNNGLALKEPDGFDHLVSREFEHTKAPYCTTVRLSRDFCGEEAKWFEAKITEEAAA